MKTKRYTTSRVVDSHAVPALARVSNARAGDTIQVITNDDAGCWYEFLVTRVENLGGSNVLQLSGRISYLGLSNVKAKIWVRNDGRVTLGIDDFDIRRQEQEHLAKNFRGDGPCGYCGDTRYVVHNHEIATKPVCLNCQVKGNRLVEIALGPGTPNRETPVRNALYKLAFNMLEVNREAELRPDALKNQIAGKANCGCVHHAEEGTPCVHDIALVTGQK